MKSTFLSPRFIFISSAVCIAAITRLISPIPNATPIAAMALFGGACFASKKHAFLIPLLAMMISDIALQLVKGYGFHDTMFYVYGSFILTTLLGIAMRRNLNYKTMILCSLASSILFFLITNFGYWAGIGFSGGGKGLIAAYTGGLPFFRNTLLGDLFFTAVLFGSFELAKYKFPVLTKVEIRN